MERQSEDSCLSFLEGVKKRKADITTLSEEEAKENSKRAKVLKTLGNCDVMENITSYLDYQDLGSLYETCQTVKESIDELSL